MTFKPHINALASEAYVAFAANKTGDWLKAKPAEEHNTLIEASRHQVRIMRQKFRYRQNKIKEKRRQKIEEQRRIKAAADAKKVQKLQEITNEVLYHGLWQSPQQVDNLLGTIASKSEKVKALKAQLRFGKEVFRQHPEDSSVYRFSKSESGKTVQLTTEELTHNVKSLIRHALTLPREIDQENQAVLVGQKVRHKFEEEGTGRWCTGRVISQVGLGKHVVNIFGSSSISLVCLI